MRERRIARCFFAFAVAAAVLGCADADPGASPPPDATADTASASPADDSAATADSSQYLNSAAPEAGRHRSPETGPMMFEGIPPWEDVVAMREGDWLINLGSFAADGAPGQKPGPGGPTATIVRASDERVAAVQQKLWDANRVPWAVCSNVVPGLDDGLVVVVHGPYGRAEADEQLASLREIVPGAYLKRGWQPR
jgi:hypothetical protein